MNEKNQPFNLEEWLESKKKGISGKIPRADFIDKIKELNQLAEKLRQTEIELTTQNKKLAGDLSNAQQSSQTLSGELKTSQSDLKEKDKVITDLNNQITSLEEQLSEQTKELKDLQQRPDLTPEKYQQLLNQQEKHQAEDLKPLNLPAD